MFLAHAKSKKVKDERNTRRENQIMDLFLASTGCKAIIKITVMVYHRELEDMTSKKNEFESDIMNMHTPGSPLTVI